MRLKVFILVFVIHGAESWAIATTCSDLLSFGIYRDDSSVYQFADIGPYSETRDFLETPLRRTKLFEHPEDAGGYIENSGNHLTVRYMEDSSSPNRFSKSFHSSGFAQINLSESIAVDKSNVLFNELKSEEISRSGAGEIPLVLPREVRTMGRRIPEEDILIMYARELSGWGLSEDSAAYILSNLSSVFTAMQSLEPGRVLSIRLRWYTDQPTYPNFPKPHRDGDKKTTAATLPLLRGGTEHILVNGRNVEIRVGQTGSLMAMNGEQLHQTSNAPGPRIVLLVFYSQ